MSTVASSAAMPRRSSSISSSSDDSPIQALDVTVEDQWADVASDTEDLSFKSLFDESVFSDIEKLLQYDKDNWGFDLRQQILRLGLDFYGCIKLVNYIRSEVLGGSKDISISSSNVFDDDRYLQPTIEDDAVLFGLDDVMPSLNSGQDENGQLPNSSENKADDSPGQEKRSRDLQAQLDALQKQFADYRLAVEKTLDERWGVSDSDGPKQQQADMSPEPTGATSHDNDYFDSYDHYEIHQTMLKDEVRTSAYRDFIYDNKHLFAGKTVLDIGCGTGILSMFAAKAGAKHVFAVDNSNIIKKARKIAVENSLQDQITFIQGKIEDIDLPVEISNQSSQNQRRNTELDTGPRQRSIDIIISEWFGYCLLFENMLDSVLYARDRYSSPSTSEPHAPVMLPSYTTLHIAPFSDPDYISSTITFWHSVYGFSMSAMLEPSTPPYSPVAPIKQPHPPNSHPKSIYEDAIDREVAPSALLSPSARFKTLNLNTIQRQELTFNSPFSTTLTADVPDGLDGFVIWFDVFFLTSSDELPADARGESWPGPGNEHKGVAITTGPHGPLTHWKHTCLFIDRGRHAEKKPVPLKKGDVVEGIVWYRKGRVNPRHLEIEVEWSIKGMEESGKQTWYLR